jgi:hypothetical protein
MNSETIRSEYGQYGAKVIVGDGTTATTPEAGFAFGSIQFVTTGALTGLTARGWTGDITGKSQFHGTRIWGIFTSVTPASGVTVIAYNIPFKIS